jgi:hypothetical protein
VAELGTGELPDESPPIVNLNSNGALQHGVRLTSEPLSADIIGMSFPDKPKISPKDGNRVAINSNLSFLPAKDSAALLSIGIAHEIGHALGAQHHGDSPATMTYENLTIPDDNVKIFDTAGLPVTNRPYVLKGVIETKMNGGESSGVQDCIMRNSSYFQWVKRVDRMGNAAYHAVPPAPPGKNFCNQRDGTGINASGNQPISYFGDAANGRGECLKHMRINDH